MTGQKTVLTRPRYRKLLNDIRALIKEGKARAAGAARQELVRAYWDVGRRISAEGLTQKAGYRQSIFEDLADDLGMDYATLTRSVRFFRTYNLATSSKALTWSHYKYLLAIHGDQERQWYEQAADQKNWSVLQLGKAIKEERYAQSKKGKGKKGHTLKLKRPTESTYVYKAIVERVIDGDTLLLRVDLGFQVFKEQRVRLAGIDTPSMDDPKGREAYTYVRDQLARGDFVMVKTHKIDIYGRYVGHVFYSFTEKDKDGIFTKGRYLNQGLLDEGLAKIL